MNYQNEQVPLEPPFLSTKEQVEKEIREGRCSMKKADVIRLWRKLTDCGLMESKDAVENTWAWNNNIKKD